MSVSRLPKGLSTAPNAVSTLWDFIAPDPTNAHLYFNDFDNYVAGDWTVTAVGVGSAAAIADIDGGAITLTDDAGATDSVVLTKKGLSFLPVVGVPMWGKFRFKVSDATNSQIMVGLTNAATAPFTLANVTDGIFFHKPAAAALVDFYVRQDATTGSFKQASVATMVDDTFITLGFYYDGTDVYYYVNDGSQKPGKLTGGKSGHLVGSSAFLPNAGITVMLAVINGAAAAKVLTVDYAFAAKKR